MTPGLRESGCRSVSGGAALGAALYIDNLTQMTNDKRAMRDMVKDPHAWVMSSLYVGAFGSFIGFGFAFGQVLVVQFKADFDTPSRPRT